MLLLCWVFLLSPGAGTEEIIGGHTARPHTRPYMAFIRFLTGNNQKRCGGTLVRRDYVLTAAHCKGSAMTVILGAQNINKKEQYQQVIHVGKAIPHPDYDPSNLANDIMLLKLKRKANLTKAVKPLSLPGLRSRLRPGQVCSAAGWGKLGMGKSFPDELQEVELTVQADKTCESLFSAYYRRATQICMGDPHQRRNGFRGDSGGPLVCLNEFQGVFSSTKKNGTPPGVFTKVLSFLPWIKRTMKHTLLGH
ncbi:granzyme H-like [Sorex fumeus]|uniref:granzyme H-like n=1 Tax=Sorex fumeus TaxID=62283 RepID=UPI0024AD9698|nr:granzyme H-like [Sorex fumeus]